MSGRVTFTGDVPMNAAISMTSDAACVRENPGHGIARPHYFAILLSHVTLAAVILPMAILTLARALRAQYGRHRQIARWTLPLWIVDLRLGYRRDDLPDALPDREVIGCPRRPWRGHGGG